MTAAEQLQALRDHEIKLRFAWRIASTTGERTDMPGILKQLIAVRRQILEIETAMEAKP